MRNKDINYHAIQPNDLHKCEDCVSYKSQPLFNTFNKLLSKKGKGRKKKSKLTFTIYCIVCAFDSTRRKGGTRGARIAGFKKFNPKAGLILDGLAVRVVTGSSRTFFPCLRIFSRLSFYLRHWLSCRGKVSDMGDKARVTTQHQLNAMTRVFHKTRFLSLNRKPSGFPA